MDDIKLPNFKYIDTDIGLKYLNNNKKLYLKILNNFLNRYRDLNIDGADIDELQDIVHSIKGLSSTLGMTNLSNISYIIHNSKMDRISEFTKELKLVIDELKAEFESEEVKTILIIDDNIENIDTLMEMLGERYDVIVSLDEKGALEMVESENISAVLLNANMSNVDIFGLYNILKERDINTTLIVDNEVLKKISNIDCYKHIKNPFHKQSIEKCINNYP
jgi:HPt (histidine-containing phosphotransfer) domain-containing protein